MPTPFTRFLIRENIAVTGVQRRRQCSLHLLAVARMAADHGCRPLWHRDRPSIDARLQRVLSILLGTESIRHRLWEGKRTAPCHDRYGEQK